MATSSGSAAAEAAALTDEGLTGVRLGDLVLGRRLGAGAVGSVYLAEQPPPAPPLAVRVLHPGLAANAPALQRFYQEAHALGRLNHPHVARAFEARRADSGAHCLIMEYAAGEPLSRLPLPLAPAAAVGLLEQVLDALECAHGLGLVHGDLHPANLVATRTREGLLRVKVLDFGMRAVLGAAFTSEEREAGMMLGARAYMAPEQWLGETTPASDLHAVGAVAYLLLTGRVPFPHGRPPTGREEVPRTPHALHPAVPRALSAVVLRALAERPEERYPSALALRFALTEALRAPAVEPPAPPQRPAPRALAAAAGRPAPAALEVRLEGAGVPAGAVRVCDVDGQGLFVLSEAPPPPLAARLVVHLHAHGRALELPAAVVRHVTAEEAAREPGALPGFLLAFVSPPDHLDAYLREASATHDPALAGLLAHAARVADDPYALLGLAPAADFPEVQRRAQAALDYVAAARARPLTEPQRRAVEGLGEALERARLTLAEPVRRAAFDAARGNLHGVARCLASGLPHDVLERLRGAHLASHPGARQSAAALAEKGRASAQRGLRATALAYFAEALRCDPFDTALQREYWSLKKDAGGGAQRTGGA